MPDSIANLLESHQWLGGFLMAVAISALRVVYDRSETSGTRILLESLLCGFLTLAVGSALRAMNYDPNWYLFCAGLIGFMGSQGLRALAYHVISKRIGGGG